MMSSKRRTAAVTFAIATVFVLLLASCSRSVICYGPSRQAKAQLTKDQIFSELASLAKQNAPMSKLAWRTKTQTAWLFVWTKNKKDIVKQSIRANPNLMLMQVENTHFMIDDAVILFTPGIRTVRFMGLGKSGAPTK